MPRLLEPFLIAMSKAQQAKVIDFYQLEIKRRAGGLAEKNLSELMERTGEAVDGDVMAYPKNERTDYWDSCYFIFGQ